MLQMDNLLRTEYGPLPLPAKGKSYYEHGKNFRDYNAVGSPPDYGRPGLHHAGAYARADADGDTGPHSCGRSHANRHGNARGYPNATAHANHDALANQY